MPDSYVKEKVWFPCSGSKCSGILYRPEGVKGRVPSIVMAHGLGAVKEMHTDEYASLWASEGLAVLAFDYRRFGESGGEPRQALYPEEQVADYRCAISYMRSLDFVDPDRIGVWGTSFSGGHVLTLLAFPPPGVRCGIAQVPNLYSYRTALKYFGTLDPLLQLAEYGREQCCRGEPATIPIVSEEGGPSIIIAKEAVEFYTKYASQFPTFKNYLTMDSLDRILAYNPGFYAELVSRPILFVVAEKDETTPPDVVDEVASRIRTEAKIVRYPVGHFKVYESPLVHEIARVELEWFKKHLEV
jgi:dienelactone hydrolase